MSDRSTELWPGERVEARNPHQAMPSWQFGGRFYVQWTVIWIHQRVGSGEITKLHTLLLCDEICHGGFEIPLRSLQMNLKEDWPDPFPESPLADLADRPHVAADGRRVTGLSNTDLSLVLVKGV